MKLFDHKTHVSVNNSGGFNLAIAASESQINVHSLSVQDLINLRVQVDKAYSEYVNKPKQETAAK